MMMKRIFTYIQKRSLHQMKIDNEITSHHKLLESWRKDFHMHPELGLCETRTSQLVAERLESFGNIKVSRNIGKTGVVGTLTGTKPGGGRTIGLRADMDALPMQELNNVEYKSQNKGVFHGCGHDGHTTMLLGAAMYLSKHTDEFSGSVNFIFQPAEEDAGGANIMIKDGLFEKFPCSEIYGIHNWPYIERGKINVQSGPIMASSDEFDIKVQGVGGHAAFPHLSTDPIVVASHLVTALQSIVSRGSNPSLPAVLSVTKFHAGSAYNVIPALAELGGTVRTFNEDERDRIENEIGRLVTNICDGFGATAKVNYRRGYPVTTNSDKETEYARKAAMATVDNVVNTEFPCMGAEDFSYMLKKVPGCYVWLGARSEGVLHEPNYDFDDSIIPIGVQYFVNLVRQRCN